jgi:OFA family oxalate/formate antiporter-like MFS transporter
MLRFVNYVTSKPATGDKTMSEKDLSKGWTVTFSGMGVNLALGILYAWSVIKGGIPDSWGWSNADKALPYSVACLIFALAMVPAGRLQDKIGPRWVSTIGGVLVGIGFIIAALTGSSLTGFVIGFGIFGGIGIGFGYASATPPAVKWFPPQKTGLIAGLVVAGFGLASVYIAPLATKLLSVFSTTMTKTDPVTGVVKQVIEKGVSGTMLVFGIAFFIIVVILSQLLRDPPKGYVPPGSPAKGSAAATAAAIDRGWRDMLSTAQFYILWLIYFAGASAGLTFISVAQDLGKRSLGELAFMAVAILAVGNACGRIVAGIISDKIGRQWTLFGFLLLQAVVLFVLFLLKGGASWPIVLLIVLLIGANYGSNLSLFPSATKDYFGLKNFGVNYGFVFTAWGVAGLIMPWVNGRIKDATGSDTLTFFIIIAVLIIAAVLTFVSRSIAARDAAAAKA